MGQYKDKINYETKSISNSSQTYVYGLQKTFNTINEVAKLGFLDEDIERLLRYESIYTFRSQNDVMRVDLVDYKEIDKIISIIKEKINGYQKILSISIPENEKNVLSVKLPQYKEISDLKEFFDKLEKALHNGLKIEENTSDGPKYQLQNFDTGSLWIDILFNKESLLLFGQLIRLAFNYQKASLTQRKMELELEHLELELDQKKMYKEAVQKRLKLILDAETKNLEGSGNYSEESINSMRKSIQTIGNLMNEGTQFHIPLNAPEEIKQAIPEPSETKAIDTIQNLLESIPDQGGDE
ncbi:hypothetical protein [Bacillus subtilis]|uniref:hypothetical protein n=1 Tax=Bacillus subtilis TaxID=1423 RepID=UPI00165AF9E1|nr:hypothetical protein [Bacillus subtilis]MCY8202023.1 hypothetical protein [Bacillus subtilis]MEC1445296.1 hypothetical protein [Bacillus subtilis]MED2970646.1 hypothetical protein [Bacillus subtilis]